MRRAAARNLVANNVLQVLILLPEAPGQENPLGMHSIAILSPVLCITSLRMPFTDLRVLPNSDCRLSIESRACGPTSWTAEQADEGHDTPPLTLLLRAVVM